MNYDSPELIERLAAEYVLGTLRGRARDRFMAVLRATPAARQAVWRWEARLHGFGDDAMSSTMPPEHVWQRIRSQLQLQRSATPLTLVQSRTDRSGIWKAATAFAVAASLVLGILLVRLSAVSLPSADHVAVFSDQESSQPQWLVSVDTTNGTLTARALNAPALEAGKAFELWMLPGEGAAPRSLGLLPTARHALQAHLPKGATSMLRATSALAISLEPAGGSTTGLPSGPVLYQAPLLRL